MPFSGTRPKCSGCGKGMIMAHEYNCQRRSQWGSWFTRTKDPAVALGQQFTCKDGKGHRVSK